MNHDYFAYINFNHTELIDEINDYINHCEKHNGFFISKLGQCRVNFPIEINRKFSQFMPFEISDYGCFKNVPEWIYPVHKDTNRTFAMNMLLSPVNSDFEALFYNDDKTESWSIPYIQNQWILLNTKKYHSVKNNSTVNRYIISIGCTNIDYSDILNTFKTNNLIGLSSDH